MTRFAVIVMPEPTPAQVGRLTGQVTPRAGLATVVFTWAGTDLDAAVTGALREIESAGLQAVRVVDNDWVTLMDIANRIGRSRELVRLWSIGRTGPGGFPPPLNPGGKTAYYSWLEVATWLHDQAGVDIAELEPAFVIANLVVRLRRLACRLPSSKAGVSNVGPPSTVIDRPRNEP